jgi:hypothetical protein
VDVLRRGGGPQIPMTSAESSPLYVTGGLPPIAATPPAVGTWSHRLLVVTAPGVRLDHGAVWRRLRYLAWPPASRSR